MQVSGVIALLVGMVASRLLNERGYRQLSAEEKVRLLDGFSGVRAYSLIPLLVLVGVLWLLTSQTQIDKQYLLFGYFSLLVVYVIAQVIFNQRKLSQLDMPAGYRQLFTLSQVVSCLGIAWFFFTMLWR